MKESNLLKESLELNKKILDVMLVHSIKGSEIFIKGYEEQIKYKTKLLASLEDEEPPKFFKKSHREWENKIKEVKAEIEKASQNLYEEYCSLGENMELLNS